MPFGRYTDSTHASILGHADLTQFVNGVQTVTHNVAVRFDCHDRWTYQRSATAMRWLLARSWAGSPFLPRQPSLRVTSRLMHDRPEGSLPGPVGGGAARVAITPV